MKKIILFLSILFLSINVFAQVKRVQNLPNYDSKRLHFGFTIGTNKMDFRIDPSKYFYTIDSIYTIYNIENEKTMGFHLGPVSNFRLGRYFDLRVLIHLSFGQRNLVFKVRDTLVPNFTIKPYTMKIASTFLEFPIQIKYKAERINNYRPYVIAGINPHYDLAARKKLKDDEEIRIMLKQTDMYYEAGVGIDFYLTYFKLSTELKFSSGFKNVLIKDNTEYTKAIDKLQSRVFMVSLHFE